MKQISIYLICLLLVYCSEDIFTECADNEWYVDADGDGFGSDIKEQIGGCEPPVGYSANNTDCDDGNPLVNQETTFYQDNDGDGFGNPDFFVVSCGQPDGYVENSSDCNDMDADSSSATTYYQDADGDGFGNPDVSILECTQPDGYVEDNTDCDDTNATITIAVIWYEDADGDGLGNSSVTIESCVQPNGYVANGDDDDDTVAQQTILQSFEEVFFDYLWYTEYLVDGGLIHRNIWASNSSTTMEATDLPLGPPELAITPFIGDLSYSLSQTNENHLLLTSSVFSEIYQFPVDSNTITITSVSEGVIDYLINDTTSAQLIRSDFRENCFDNNRIFNAEWLVANNDVTRDYLTNDSIRLESNISMIGIPVNHFGEVLSPEFDSNGSFVDIISNCNDFYFSLEEEFYDGDIFTSPHELSSIVRIEGDELILGDNEQYRLLIVD